MEAAKKQNIVIQYLIWHFYDVPRGLIKAWQNYLLFNLNYFSLLLLVKTFFAPWRRYVWSYGRGFDLKKYFEALVSNLISRIIGAIVRSFLILIGLVTEIFVFLAGLILVIGWLVLPLLLVYGLFFGFKIIF